MTVNFLKTFLISCSLTLFIFSVGKSAQAIELQIQKPAEISIPGNIKKIFIHPGLFRTGQDKLGIKNQLLDSLKNELNSLGRFQVVVGPPKGYDPNREAVVLIQGEVISGEKAENGQGTDKADCSLTSGVGFSMKSEYGETKSRRGLTCRHTEDFSETPSINLSDVSLKKVGDLFGLDLPDVKAPDIQQPVDQVIRTYRFTNHSMFAQVQFSVTVQGLKRETLLVKTESAAFNRQIIDKKSFKNIRESGDQFRGSVWPLLLVSPVVNINQYNIGVIVNSVPNTGSRYYNRVIPLPRKEKTKIQQALVKQLSDPFIKTISPYTETLETDLAEGSDKAVQLLNEQNFKEAKAQLLALNKPTPEDLYNTGLSFEATAANRQDLDDAKRFYAEALEQQPATELYAQALGRIEYQLKIYKKLEQQTKN